MKGEFYKFPSTPHLGILPGVEIRNDKVLTLAEREEFLSHFIIVEEKVDGANLGISFNSDGQLLLQNRGNYFALPGAGQWKKLCEWIQFHFDRLIDCLLDRYILFGEWCYAQHSIYYDHLPDWFLAFDIYDRHQEKFFSTSRRDELIDNLALIKVPQIVSQTHCSYSELLSLMAKSAFADGPAEGIYLRFDDGEWLGQRAKIVRPDFTQAIGRHWSRSSIRPNCLLTNTEY